MNRRRTEIAANIAAELTRTGSSPAMLAQATGMDTADLDACLHQEQDFTVTQLVLAGGFFLVHPLDLIKEAA